MLRSIMTLNHYNYYYYGYNNKVCTVTSLMVSKLERSDADTWSMVFQKYLCSTVRSIIDSIYCLSKNVILQGCIYIIVFWIIIIEVGTIIYCPITNHACMHSCRNRVWAVQVLSWCQYMYLDTGNLEYNIICNKMQCAHNYIPISGYWSEN